MVVASAPAAGAARGVAGLRVAYAVSIALLAVLAVATLASPIVLRALRPERETLPEGGKVQVLAAAGEWVLQYNLVNQGSAGSSYSFELDAPRAPGATGAADPADAMDAARPGTLHTSSVFVDAGRSYVFIYHIRPEQVPDGTVHFTVQRAGEAAPLEDLTLHLTPGSPGGAAR